MQAIMTILADLTVFVTSILLIVHQVHGIVTRFLYVLVVTTMCFFVVAYTATCVHKGKCEWTGQEFKEVAYCTLRPDQCTHLLPKIGEAVASEYWKHKVSQHQVEAANLRSENERLRRERQAAAAEAEAAREAARRAERTAIAVPPPAMTARHQLEQEPPQADGLTWMMTNHYGYKISVIFFSKARPGHVWPGNNQVFVLNSGAPTPLRIRCLPGEKICYGAWPTGNPSRYWGVGPLGRAGCDKCCASCGSSLVTSGLR